MYINLYITNLKKKSIATHPVTLGPKLCQVCESLEVLVQDAQCIDEVVKERDRSYFFVSYLYLTILLGSCVCA